MIHKSTLREKVTSVGCSDFMNSIVITATHLQCLCSMVGHVNPIGPRACYDEGKRVAEALTYGYARQDNVEVRVARIFNTFGPRMSATECGLTLKTHRNVLPLNLLTLPCRSQPNSGRVVSNFIIKALKGEDLVIFGDGKQSRSLQYVHDLVDGMILLVSRSPCLAGGRLQAAG